MYHTGPWGPQFAICGHIGYRDLIRVFSRDTKKVYHTGTNWARCGHIGWGSYHKIHYPIGGHIGFKGFWVMYIILTFPTRLLFPYGPLWYAKFCESNWAICGHIGWGSDYKIYYSIGGHMGFKGLWGMYIKKGAHYTVYRGVFLPLTVDQSMEGCFPYTR